MKAAAPTLEAGVARARRILEGLDARAAREFTRITRMVLGDEAAAWPDGLLNQSDSPLEFSFGPGAAGLRYTMELGGTPGTPPAGRLADACSLLDALGAAPSTGGAVEALAALQRGRPLAWGAWLAARQAPPDGGAVQTRYKLYAEIPDGRDETLASLLVRHLGAATLPAGTFGRPVMAGTTPGAQRCEFYFELGRRAPSLAELRSLLAHVGLAHLRDELAAQIATFAFRHRPEPGALPLAHYGFSYAALPGGGDPVFSLYVFARDLRGGDGWIRHQALHAARRAGTRMPEYEALTAPLADHAGNDFHNMLTFHVGADTPPGWMLSLAPPPEPAAFIERMLPCCR